LNQPVSFAEGEGPRLPPLRSAADLDKLSLDGFQEKLLPVYQTVHRLSSVLPPATALIGFAGAPWTVATYMVEGGSSRDFLLSKRLAFGDPGLFQRLIDLLVQATGDYLIAQIDHGAEAVQLFDSWAGVLPEDAFERWVVEPTGRLVARLKAERPGIPVIGFPRGAGALYEAYVAGTGVDAVSLDSTVPLKWAAERLGTRVTLQGNLDPVLLLTGGPALDAGIDRILSALRDVPFVFNLGHGILPETPPEHVLRLVERVRGGA
jgi:uroporphyrinogen decarboxylase